MRSAAGTTSASMPGPDVIPPTKTEFSQRLETYGFRDVLDGSSNTIAFSEKVMASFGINGKASPRIQEGTLTSVATITTNPGACLAAAAAISNGTHYTTWSLVKGKFSSV